MYAIVDIETTGSYASANGITEISIFFFDGEKITGSFTSLINPGQPIPRYIQAMTGISDEMVEKAPAFEEVAEKIHALLQDRIFVAHNVNFDYSFVKSQLDSCGFMLDCKKLCTVRLSRKIFPGLPSYSLGNLCHSLEIKNKRHHRAAGDAEATAKIFALLIQHDRDDHIKKSLARSSKESSLPPHVPREDFERLPYTPGVYFFHDAKDKIVYVGKAANIRYRVSSHFSNNSTGRQKQNFMRYVHRISYEPCGTELMAFILESVEIKKRWPPFNRSQKNWEDIYGLFSFEDQKGYLRLAIDKLKKRQHPVITFHYMVDGHNILRKLIQEYGLCPKLCFMQKDNGPCEGMKTGYCRGACEQKEKPAKYNKRVKEACHSLQEQPSFAIIDKGIDGQDRSCILIENGKFYGMGYLPEGTVITSVNGLKNYLTAYRENNYIRNMVTSYASRFPAKVIMLENETV